MNSVDKQCKKCGLLSLRNSENRQLVEVEHGFRQTGDSPENDGFKYQMGFVCFGMECDLQNEFEGPGNSSCREVRLGTLTAKRDCEKFTAWQQGYSPKEHMDMLMIAQQHETMRRQHRDTLLIAPVAAILGGIFTLCASWATIHMAPQPVFAPKIEPTFTPVIYLTVPDKAITVQAVPTTNQALAAKDG